MNMFLPIVIACLPDMSVCNQHGISGIVEPFGQPNYGTSFTNLTSEEDCTALVAVLSTFVEENSSLIVVEASCYSFAPGANL